jgi:hypothetical protein
VLLPVRDWIILPAFFGVEHATAETAKFLQSEAAHQLAGQSLELVKKVPIVGDNVLAPAMYFSVGLVQRTWEIVQYPIPSKQQVRGSVELALNGTKWALSTVGREVYLYFKRADANITRTLMHTQWKVLGSGPYATLDKLNKSEVINHLCERYFSLEDAISRYELAAHIKSHNVPLYHDLVVSGLLKDRGGGITEDDEWLSSWPVYRHLEDPFLIPEEEKLSGIEISSLWFRLPYLNGKRPSGRDQRWVCFGRIEQNILEDRYRHVIREGVTVLGIGEERKAGAMEPSGLVNEADTQISANHTTNNLSNVTSAETNCVEYPTIAKWYVPNAQTDVFLDQRRHTVSLFLCCPKCRNEIARSIPPLVAKEYGELCDSCNEQYAQMPSVSTLLAPPPIGAVMRPTFWRFHGPGDEVRRAAWILDTPRHGLQPFDEEAQSVLEDAYLFLKWMSVRQEFRHESDLDSALLTVEVPCPDGTDRLIQFSSLTQATAIQKGMLPAVAIFKRRVYRGAWLQNSAAALLETKTQKQELVSVQESILQAIQDNGALGETIVPDAALRTVLSPGKRQDESRLVLHTSGDDLAVPPSRLWEEGSSPVMESHPQADVDHLILVVHGIGEMLRSIDVFGLAMPNLSSIVDCCGFLRKNHSEVQDAHFAQMYPTADATSRASTGRVEYLPIEWHESFSLLSQRRSTSEATPKHNVMIKDISLRTIPNMREFANDTLMDVLYFMSPEHHDMIMSIVTNEMNVVVEKFAALAGFSGRVSLIGHSLGSIISWDILANQSLDILGESAKQSLHGVPSIETFGGTGFSNYGSATSVGHDAPEVTQQATRFEGLKPDPKLRFAVDNFFLLGSPVAVFLMIRNQRKPLCENYFLSGCNRVFNIFHPYDPVAYRVEPCIDPRNADFEPTIMKHWNGGFRVQYQTKRLWKKFVDSTWKTQQSVVEAFEASMAGMGLLDATTDTFNDDDTSASEISSDDNRSTANVIAGKLNQGRRIDYMLQEKEIETANEYVAALAAHSSYWIEKDLSLFVARQIYLSTLEQSAEAAEASLWESIGSNSV